MATDSHPAPANGAAAGGVLQRGDGVIHDIGYQRYDGPRLSRPHIVAALTWHSLRSAFGFRRGAKAKIVPVLTFVIMCAPAVVNAIAMALSQQHLRIVNYDTYVNSLRVLVMLAFIAAQAPELVARDLRSKVLPLYFARPIRRLDYPAAKYAAFTLACLAMIDIPVLLLYIGTIFQVHGGSAIWAQTKAAIPGLLVGLMWAVVLAAVGLALASVSGRRAFSTGAVAIFLFLTYTLAHVLTAISRSGPPGPGQGGGPFGGGGGGSTAPAAAHLFGLISPYTVLDGVRQWLGGTNPGIVDNPGNYGVAYGVMLLVFLGFSLTGLFLRYRRADLA
jgi:ABC-2 type transport system permease protein